MLLYQVFTLERFLDQLRVLARKDRAFVVAKVYEILPTNPHADGQLKLRLRNGHATGLHRMEVGDFRVFYTLDAAAGWLALQAVDRRDEETFARAPRTGRLGTLTKGLPAANAVPEALFADTESALAASRAELEPRDEPPPPTALPRRIDIPMLVALGIDERFWETLQVCRTEDDLLEAAVPARVAERLLDVLYAGAIVLRPLERQWAVGSGDELLGLLEGDLPAVLLRLDPEQQKLATWPIGGSGPALVTGGPGSGKSVVAAYRARSLIQQLRAAGVAEPRLLVTSYTNALVAATQLLLERLLGPDTQLVDVRTADNVVSEVMHHARRPYNPKDDGVARFAVSYGRNRLANDGAAGRELARSIERLSIDYLTQEIERTIVGSNIEGPEQYLGTPRTGREAPLQRRQREAVWRVFEAYEEHLRERGYHTYAQTRREAMRIAESGRGPRRKPRVIVDQAQDLDPTVIRMLFALCERPDRMFITADSNQQVYGGGFSWTRIHEDLKVRGRTAMLSACYRSTAEIGAAAEAWFPDPKRPAVAYRRSGPIPAAVPVGTMEEAARAIRDFIRAATRELRVVVGSCAVLVPTNDVGHLLAQRLKKLDLPAQFSPGKALDLAGTALKVVTYQSAKGLEFPVVAMLDFDVSAPTGNDEERRERAALERRVRFVAMTRAMQALALFRLSSDGSLPYGLAEPHWRIGAPDDWAAWVSGAVGIVAP
jgi:mRNA-degrading endonuclease RelE of RelBE toxin-antitoxin system